MTQRKQLRIAILGSRGIPAEFGGFETFAEQLSVRLVACGEHVTVFCEPSQQYDKPEYKGVALRYIYTPEIPGLRSVWFDLISILKTLRGYDIVYMLGYHAAFAFILPYIFKRNFWVNMDGLEWKRSKWSPAVQRYLKISESLACRFARHLVADAQGIAEHLTTSYPFARDKATVIEYGAFPIENAPPLEQLAHFGLRPQEYYLVVCRLEPENNVREIIEGFLGSSSRRVLIVVGDHASGTAYVKSLLDCADDRVRFLGTVFDPDKLTALRYYCAAYLHGHSVGGTNPSLLEAMACGNYVLAHDNAFNREVTCNLCRYFKTAADTTAIIDEVEHQGIPSGVGLQLRQRASSYYNWDRIAQVYDTRFHDSIGATR